MSRSVTPHQIRRYRARTYRSTKTRALKNLSEAVDFVSQRGFVFLWPVKGVELPSLWSAVAGNRPIASEHDDPGHVTWGWKDQMLDQKVWYYGKLLRGKATFVSLELLPYFYALAERVGDLDDYNLPYEEGRLTWEEKSIADAIFKHGPLHTIELRRKAQLSANSAKSRFDRALTALQRGLWILPIGVAEAGAWHYAFIYEMLDRWYPEVVSNARPIGIGEAYRRLTRVYLESVGAASAKEISKIFRWNLRKVRQILAQLEDQGETFQLDDGRWAVEALMR